MWEWHNIKNVTSKYFTKLALLGLDEIYKFRRILKVKEQRKLNLKYRNHFYPVASTEFPTLILAPKGLEFPWANIAPNEMYFKYKSRSSWILTDQEYDEYNIAVMDIYQKKTEGFKVVLCIMGSMTIDYIEQCVKFYKNLIGAVSTLSKVILLLRVENFIKSSNELGNNEHVYILSACPQVDSLRKLADVFIFHGGLGSLGEALEFEIPMLIYPMNLKGDNPGNGSRVVYHKLGLRGTISDSQKKIQKSINYLLRNTRLYKSRLRNYNQLNSLNNDNDFYTFIK